MPRKDRFYIAQIEEEKKPQEKKETFATPYSGSNASDNYEYPYVKYDNDGRQFASFKNGNNLEEEKPVDKYDPSRIPSYFRQESNSGITSGSLADLKGEKKTQEEILEYNRRMYGNTFQQFKQAEEERKKAQEEVNKPSSGINSPIDLNNPRYGFTENGVDENLFKDEPPKVTEKVIESPFAGYEKPQYTQEIHEEPKVEVKPRQSGLVFEDNNVNTFREQETLKPVEQDAINDTPADYDNRVNNMVTDDFGNITPSEPTPAPAPRVRTLDVVTPPKDLVFGNPKAKFVTPPFELLRRNGKVSSVDGDAVNYQISVINRTFEDFKVGGKVITFTKGPTVTQFEVKLDPGVNVNKVTGLQKNLQMNLESESIRIQAPIPGKSTVGIEAPNVKKDLVLFGDMVTNDRFLKDGKPLNVILGLSISGEPTYANIGDMPHALVAGATGGGKTVCLYSIIGSMIFKASPEEVKMILVDPKRNELIYFEDIPHLATPVIDDPKLAAAALKWAVDEMDRRYDFLKANRKRTIGDYNSYARSMGMKIIPYLVIVIDEFADLMNTASESFETNVQRLTQKARSAGIHLIIATQRPTTDVIKGTIKANIPTRIAFTVQSQVDSQTILDHMGAEKLLGKGDMLYTKGNNDVRIQGAYISEDELDAISTFYLEQDLTPNYMFTHDDLRSQVEQESNNNSAMGGNPIDDEYFEDIARFVFRQRKASANQIQGTYEIGFNRANKIIMGLADLGIVSSDNIPGKARDVLIKDIDELEEILKNR